MDASFNSAEDATLSLKDYLRDRPPAWSRFFDLMFPYQSKLENIIQKCDTIFEIIYYLVHNGKKKNLLHLTLCKSIHDTCRSKKLIAIMNRIRLFVGYDEFEIAYIKLDTQNIESARENKVPVLENTENSIVMHGAMDILIMKKGLSLGLGAAVTYI